LLKTWQALAPFVPHLGARVTAMLLLGLAASIAESIALLVTVRVAMTLTNIAEPITIPIFGGTDARILIAVAVAAAGGTLLLHVAIARVNGAIAAETLERLRTETIASYAESTWEAQSAEREGSLQETAGSLSRQASQLVQAFAILASNTLMLLVFIGTSLIVSPIATLVVVVVGLTIFGVLRPLARAQRRAGAASTKAGSRYAQDVARFSSTSMEFKVFGVQAAAQRQLATSSRASASAMRVLRYLTSVGNSMFRDVAIGLLAACVATLVLFQITAEAVGIFTVITLVVRALASAQSVSNGTQAIHENAHGLTAVLERIEHWTAGREISGEQPIAEFGSLRLGGVGYRYPGTESGVHDLDLTIHAGEAIGVIGRSGAGKSTFVQLLLRLRRPTTGGIDLDGLDYAEIAPESWARLLGFVPQEPSLLEGTVASNIDFDRGLSDSVIRRAADDAHVSEDIQALDGGFDHVLGPRGAGLSGGQKQRVAIARALAARPRLLVLDEPTSALDPRSERLLVETLSELKGRTTMVIVAHRKHTVAMCDRLVVFEGGTIVQVGTPAELLAQEGYYKSMFIDS